MRQNYKKTSNLNDLGKPELKRQGASTSLIDSGKPGLKRQGASSDLLGDDPDFNKVMKEKRNQARSDNSLKQRKQTISAESAGKKQKGKNGASYIKMGGNALAFAISSAPTLIGTYIAGCNYKVTSEAEPAELEFAASLFGVGVEAGIEGEFKVVVEHEASKTDIEEEETSVSFTLSDPDIDDEFVVDIYYDEYYGTFIFNTVAGRSKCIWEKGTGFSEDPSLLTKVSASSFVYPDETMVFEVEMNNKGKTGDSFFYVAQEATSRNLRVDLGGSGLINENGHVIQLYQNSPVIKQIIVHRGINGYEFPAIQLTLMSKCEADMNTRQNEEDGRYITTDLYNHINELGEPVLKWVEPCPKIYWSGDLKRERTFLINRDTLEDNNQEKILRVVVFNPLVSSGKNITKLRDSGKLQNINLRYRRRGLNTWDTAQTLSSKGSQTNLDFLNEEVEVKEDPYGFSALIWSLDTVEQGTLEIML